MRHSIPLLLVVAFHLALPSAPAASLREGFAKAFDELALGFRLMRLATEPPDTVLVLPVRTTRADRIVDTWHSGRSEGRRHEGQDIFARRGTPVYSATRGYVTRIGENRLGGLTVWITGAGRRLYYYAHLDAWPEELSEGDRVDTGTVIGYVGDTGNARGTPPHLHFGVYTMGGALNPLPLIRNPGG
jgi:murein DD-endopeptidase MepM/ murein hydrolase activator NlpD